MLSLTPLPHTVDSWILNVLVLVRFGLCRSQCGVGNLLKVRLRGLFRRSTELSRFECVLTDLLVLV